jgi:hypothetical protein
MRILSWIDPLITGYSEVEVEPTSATDSSAICEPFIAETRVVPDDELAASPSQHGELAQEVCEELCEWPDVLQDSVLAACVVVPPARDGDGDSADTSAADESRPRRDTTGVACLWVVDCLGF